MTSKHPRRPSSGALLRAAKVPALLITNTANIRYLTGIAVSSGCVLVLREGIRLFVDGRYLEAARASAWSGVRVHPIGDFPKIFRKLRRAGFEAEEVTVAKLSRWKRRYKNTKFVHKEGIVEEFRRKKALDELRWIHRACAVTRRILRKVPAFLKPGISELRLVHELSSLAYRFGSEGMAFDTIVAFGEHTAFPHHHSTHRILKTGDLVQVDMGVRVGGYCSDFSRVFFTGRKLPQQARAYAALQRVKQASEALVRPGITNRALDRRARDMFKKEGFDREFCHALGHGLGLEIHEGVSLSGKAPLRRLKKHEVITIEPGLYFEGQWGMRLEDTIMVQ